MQNYGRGGIQNGAKYQKLWNLAIGTSNGAEDLCYYKNFSNEERYGFTSQLRRAAYSIPMNLIEGGAKLGERDFRRLVDISIESCAEVEYQIELCHDLNYLSEAGFVELSENYQRIGKILNHLMQKLITKEW